VRDLGCASGLLELSVSPNLLTVGDGVAAIFPPGGLFNLIVLQDVGTVVSESELCGCVEPELSQTGWLMHG